MGERGLNEINEISATTPLDSAFTSGGMDADADPNPLTEAERLAEEQREQERQRIRAVYRGRHIAGTTMFRNFCRACGVPLEVRLSLRWVTTCLCVECDTPDAPGWTPMPRLAEQYEGWLAAHAKRKHSHIENGGEDE